MSKPFVVACIPAYNEEKAIGGVVVQVMKYVDQVVVCDDGSEDLTSEIAGGLGAEVVRHERNIGKGAALKTAFLRARDLEPDVVVMLDADGQHDPEDIPLLVTPIVHGKGDFVIGSRYVDGGGSDPPFYRKVGLGVLNRLSRTMVEDNYVDSQSGFRAFSAKAIDIMLKAEADGFGVESEQLALARKHGLKIVEVPTNIKYEGLESTSKKNPMSHGSEVFGTIIRNIVEDKPLTFLGAPGVFFILFGFSMFLYFFWYYTETRYFSLPMALISGISSIVGLLLIISALTLYVLADLRNTIRALAI